MEEGKEGPIFEVLGLMGGGGGGGGGEGGRRGIVVNSFYTALFSTLEQTHCARIVSGAERSRKTSERGAASTGFATVAG